MPRGLSHEVTITRSGEDSLVCRYARCGRRQATRHQVPRRRSQRRAYAKGADPIRSAGRVVVADMEAHLRQKSEKPMSCQAATNLLDPSRSDATASITPGPTAIKWPLIQRRHAVAVTAAMLVPNHTSPRHA